MQDLYHVFGQDLVVSAAGDLLSVDDSIKDYTQQNILRNLLTSVGQYLWNLGYGVGIGKYVGMNITGDIANEISALIEGQMIANGDVATTPPPVATVTSSGNGVYVHLKYTDKATGTLQSMSFTVN